MSDLVRIRYRSRSGHIKIHTPQRAVETCWGQSTFRRGEALALATVEALFPADDWRHNVRPAFLKTPISRTPLELDGYSEQLQIGLEFQGAHHYRPRRGDPDAVANYRTCRQYDRIKIRLCAKAGVRLIVVPTMDYDPALFVNEVARIARNAGLTPADTPSVVGAVARRWQRWCLNPLNPIQDQVAARLAEHILLSPPMEEVTRHSTLVYRCAECGAANTVQAKTLTADAPRKSCPKCMHGQCAASRRAATEKRWIMSGIPESLIDRLEYSKSGWPVRIYKCGSGHTTPIWGSKQLRRLIGSGEPACPKCVEIAAGPGSAAYAMRVEGRLLRTLTDLGLSFIGATEGSTKVQLRCPDMHDLSLTEEAIRSLHKSKVLMDRKIVPYGCPICCFPGVEPTDWSSVRASIFHRLYVLQGMYLRADYAEGFDPSGWGKENYGCGRCHDDRTPHPEIRISFRDLMRYARLRPLNHLCAACGVEAGQMIGRRKTLEDVAGQVHAMRDIIARQVPLNAPLSAPTVRDATGILGLRDEISTTQTKLVIHCGVPGHAEQVATRDEYFNRTRPKFCPECLGTLPGGGFPKPVDPVPDRRLRKIAIRCDGEGEEA